MNIAIDTDVFFRDPWLEGQEIRVLLNFLKRTHSKVLLLDTVYAELRERVKREFSKPADELAVALSHADHKKLRLLPTFDVGASVEETMKRWEGNFNNVFSSSELERLPLDSTVLSEAIHRAVTRVAPCKKNGEGMRDAVIWLNFLEHAKSLAPSAELAFITSNSEDYAAADKVSLRPELQTDLDGVGCSVRFFVHLAAFNKAHSNHIQHITPEWVRDKGITRSINEALNRFFHFAELADYFHVSSVDYDDYYEPEALETVHSMEVEVDDVTAWNFSEGRSELKVEFSVDIEADALCSLTIRPSVFWDRQYHDDLDDEYPSQKSLTCYAQLQGSIAAMSHGEELIVGELEELMRR